MKKLFVVLLTAIVAITLMLSGCMPQDAKGPQAWWEGTVAAGKNKSVSVQIVGANGALGQAQDLPDGTKIRTILNADLKVGSAVSLCRGTRMFAEIKGSWIEVNPLTSVKMMSNQIITDFGTGGTPCACYTVVAKVDVPMGFTVWDIASNSPTPGKLTVAPGTNIVFCSCIEIGPTTLVPGTIVWVPADGGSGSCSTPCIVEAPMNVTITGRLGMTTEPSPEPVH